MRSSHRIRDDAMADRIPVAVMGKLELLPIRGVVDDECGLHVDDLEAFRARVPNEVRAHLAKEARVAARSVAGIIQLRPHPIDDEQDAPGREPASRGELSEKLVDGSLRLGDAFRLDDTRHVAHEGVLVTVTIATCVRRYQRPDS